MAESSKEVQENEKDLPPLRSYQDRLLEIALQENVIIYLPTGAGKTYIALSCMKRMAHQLKGSIKDGGKRSVFLCNTIALAKQQAEVIKQSTNLICSVYTGDLNVDNWKKDKWVNEFETNQVLVATTQIILDCIRHGHISITNFNLMIFDECHHAKGGHPMFQIMTLFAKYPSNEQPRVIGLSGSLINPSSKFKVIEELNYLETTFRGKIVTVQNLDQLKNVMIFSTNPNEALLIYRDDLLKSSVSREIAGLVEEMLNKIKTWNTSNYKEMKQTKNLAAECAPNPLKKLINLFKDLIHQMEDMGLYAASICVLAMIVELELKKRAAIEINLRCLYRCAITYAERMRRILIQTFQDSIEEDDDEMTKEKIIIRTYSTPKVIKLLNYFETTFRGKNANEIKALVFVQRRMTAKILYYIIQHWADCNSDIQIKPQFMVGRHESMPESIDSVLSEKWNKDVLQAFRKNECNLIVCSSVLEEGIDVQSCNYVIMFDPIQTIRSYVQTKGRARKEGSSYVIMVKESEQVLSFQKIREYKEIDAVLKNYLIEKSIDREPPQEKDIQKHIAPQIQPFYTCKGARLDENSALQLLVHYVSMLPNDSFTKSFVRWKKLPDEFGKIRIAVILPPQTPCKDHVLSDLMPSVRLSKQSAAFNACKQLYELGELNDNLLPISKRIRTELVTPIYFKHWEEHSDDDVDAGTKKKRRCYNIEYPKYLNAAAPNENNTNCYLYSIYLTPLFYNNENNKHLIDLFDKPNTYGILTTKLLPKIAEIPLFMSYGEIRAKISPTPIPIQINDINNLHDIRKFHTMIFNDLLELNKTFLANDYRNDKNSYFIVPTIKGKEIDWNLIKRFPKIEKFEEMTERRRAKHKYNIEDFDGSTVTPWYSVDQQIRYVVRKVRTDLTPSSPFPDTSFENFADYIEKKYHIIVMNKTNQFLIEVKPITTALEFLHYQTENKAKKRKLDDIILIPELCQNYLFPGEMYLKAKFLPSILYRLHHILLAEELRQNINSYLKLNFDNYSPQVLIVDYTLPRLKEEQNKGRKNLMSSYLYGNLNDESNVKPIKEHTKSITDHALYQWKNSEEPIDYFRHLDTAFRIDIDYYHIFCNSRGGLTSLTIKDDETSDSNWKIYNAIQNLEPKNSSSSSGGLKAIQDLSPEEKSTIKILNIDEPTKSAEQWEFLSALTAASTGDVFDMERLEVLGDSFLKFSISLYLLHKHPTWHEGHLTAVKGKFVSNRNLLYCAMKHKIPGYLCVKQFNPKQDWLPPLINVPQDILEILENGHISPNILYELELDENEKLSGYCKNDTKLNFVSNLVNPSQDIESELNTLINKQTISDKVCADSIEAIIGVCVKNYGIKKSFSMLEFFNICPNGENLSNLLNLDLGNPRLKPNISDQEVDTYLINYKQLEDTIDYKFNDRAYLLQALTHPSFPTNHVTGCYQQLEFIGDAILDFLITSYIFERCEQMDPGKLTDLRSALVNNITLGCLAVRNKFHLFMLSQNAVLTQAIDNFVRFQKTNQYKITDQVRILTSENERKNIEDMADYVDVPKALGDIFESIIGAIFLDSGNDLKCTWNIIYNLMSNELNEFMNNVPIQTVRQLYEYHGADPKFTVFDDENDVCMVTCKFKCHDKICEVDGFGKNKEQAKIAAAKLALQKLMHA